MRLRAHLEGKKQIIYRRNMGQNYRKEKIKCILRSAGGFLKI
jgi:hypothetical protein